MVSNDPLLLVSVQYDDMVITAFFRVTGYIISSNIFHLDELIHHMNVCYSSSERVSRQNRGSERESEQKRKGKWTVESVMSGIWNHSFLVSNKHTPEPHLKPCRMPNAWFLIARRIDLAVVVAEFTSKLLINSENYHLFSCISSVFATISDASSSTVWIMELIYGPHAAHNTTPATERHNYATNGWKMYT